jgi:hypothetical protein
MTRRIDSTIWRRGLGLVVAVLLALVSCATTENNTGLTDIKKPFKLSGEVSNWDGQAAILHVPLLLVGEPTPPGSDLELASANISPGAEAQVATGTINAQGVFALTLPAVIGDENLGSMPSCEGVAVSPRPTQVVMLEYLEAYKGDTLLGRVYHASADVSGDPPLDPEQGVSGVVWVYAAKAVKVNGRCADALGGQAPFRVPVTLDVKLKSGWNAVIVSLSDFSETSIELNISTGAAPANVRWLFDNSYALSSLKLKLALHKLRDMVTGSVRR